MPQIRINAQARELLQKVSTNLEDTAIEIEPNVYEIYVDGDVLKALEARLSAKHPTFSDVILNLSKPNIN